MGYEPIDDEGRAVTLLKRRRCEWCGEWLEAGERAVTRTYRFAGSLNDTRMHPECFEAMQQYYARSDVYADDSFDGYQMVRGKPASKWSEELTLQGTPDV